MEYILKAVFEADSHAVWSACAADSTTAEAGEYYVRLKGTDTLLAGATAVVTVTETMNPPTLYQVTVNHGTIQNGTGVGNFAEGATVTVTADAASDGQHFQEWTVVSGGVTLADSTNVTTTFTMPAHEVTITAAYAEDSASTPPEQDETGNSGAGDSGTSSQGTTGDGTDDSGTGNDDTEDYGEVAVEATTSSASAVEAVISEPASDKSAGDTPGTGDYTPIGWLLVLMLGSGSCLVYFRRNKKLENGKNL